MQYFERMNSSLRGDRVKNIVRESDGFSFAQLREAYIIAGQAAFENKREINAEDVLKGVKALRNASQLASRQNNRTGFLD
jgi:hypothetical protein